MNSGHLDVNMHSFPAFRTMGLAVCLVSFLIACTEISGDRTQGSGNGEKNGNDVLANQDPSEHEFTCDPTGTTSPLVFAFGYLQDGTFVTEGYSREIYTWSDDNRTKSIANTLFDTGFRMYDYISMEVKYFASGNIERIDADGVQQFADDDNPCGYFAVSTYTTTINGDQVVCNFSPDDATLSSFDAVSFNYDSGTSRVASIEVVLSGLDHSWVYTYSYTDEGLVSRVEYDFGDSGVIAPNYSIDFTMFRPTFQELLYAAPISSAYEDSRGYRKKPMYTCRIPN